METGQISDRALLIGFTLHMLEMPPLSSVKAFWLAFLWLSIVWQTELKA